jgi:hypothetical protein
VNKQLKSIFVSLLSHKFTLNSPHFEIGGKVFFLLGLEVKHAKVSKKNSSQISLKNYVSKRLKIMLLLKRLTF